MTEKEFYLYWKYCLYIEHNLEVTSQYVEICENNYSTYSNEFAKIILLACSEIDVICKLLCKEIDSGILFDERNSNIRTYTSIILNRFPNIPDCELSNKLEHVMITPFTNWSNNPYNTPEWWKDYQNIKHQRHQHFNKATLRNTLYSVAGLIILELYLYRIVSNKPYACPDERPKILGDEFFQVQFCCRPESHLPDFENG